MRLAEGEELVVDGAAVHGEHAFGVLPERGGVNPVVRRRGDRGRASGAAPTSSGRGTRTTRCCADYPGTPAYAPDPRWAVTGRYVPFDEPRPTTVGRRGGGAAARLRRPGPDRVRPRRAAAVAHGVQRRDAGQPVRAVHRRDVGGDDLRGQPVAEGRRPGRRRHGAARLQPGHQPAVRLHASSRPARCRRRRTACPSPSRRGRRSRSAADPGPGAEVGRRTGPPGVRGIGRPAGPRRAISAGSSGRDFLPPFLPFFSRSSCRPSCAVHSARPNSCGGSSCPPSSPWRSPSSPWRCPCRSSPTCRPLRRGCRSGPGRQGAAPTRC